MLVTDVLTIIQQKGHGSDHYTADDQNLMLSFLNKAHFDLWDAIAHLDSSFLVSEDKSFTTTNNEFTTAKNKTFKSSLRVINKNTGVALKELNKVFAQTAKGIVNDTQFFYRKSASSISLVTPQNLDVSIYYTPSASYIQATDDLSGVYPNEKHHLMLADGGFYHLCYAQDGVRSQAQQAKAKEDWLVSIKQERDSLLNAQYYTNFGK